ncbi:hypothetical protein CASFOL_023190 [Castilleja foliolosa]|uniref:Transmembrane protein n=1 Tax=Castilleja foliolosa TaxID=1961234 RepID=A0ABD3CMQ3_9LAMI
MALTLDTSFLNKNSALFPTHFSKSPFPHPDSKTHLQKCRRFSVSQSRPFASAKIQVFEAAEMQASFENSNGAAPEKVTGNSGGASLDAFLSTIEILSLASSAAGSIYVAVRCGIQKGGGGGLGLLGSKILVWQCVVFVVGLVVGAMIRRRQWKKICCGSVGFSRGLASYGGANLLERIERLEEDLQSAGTIVQALARRLEKLGIRFRVARKALKEPIAETAALVQKNSEATRALAAQEDNLEKELGEIQKVLLAMQEQQQKQLELILAIGKARKLWETKHVKSQDEKASEASNSGSGRSNKSGNNQIER